MINKLKFLTYWSLLSFVIIPISYLVSLMVVLIVHSAFGYNQMQGGTYLSQTVMQVAGGAVIGLGTGLYQKSLLNEIFKVSTSWIYTLIIGFSLTELIVCIVLWQINVNRYELRFIEGNPIPEVIIFSICGLVVGILQWFVLKKHFNRCILWILASALGWGLCVLATIISPFAFFIGALLYGAITGTIIVWILQKKE